MHKPYAGPLVPAYSKSVDHTIAAPAAQSDTKPSRAISVATAALLPGNSPRSQELDQEHAARLADYEGAMPPILVNRRDLRVIDGMHRPLAAYIRSQETIDVEFFEGSPKDAFLRAVEADVTHGLPLSLADRRAAASRMIASHPQMSDRAGARASGLGSKAVAAIRRRSTDAKAQLNTRVGRDGRVRPLNSAEGRLKAAEVIAQTPGRRCGRSPGSPESRPPPPRVTCANASGPASLPTRPAWRRAVPPKARPPCRRHRRTTLTASSPSHHPARCRDRATRLRRPHTRRAPTRQTGT